MRVCSDSQIIIFVLFYDLVAIVLWSLNKFWIVISQENIRSKRQAVSNESSDSQIIIFMA